MPGFRVHPGSIASLVIVAGLLIPTLLPAQKDHQLIEMTWMKPDAALEKAKQARYGVLFYFPPADSEEDHAAFQSVELCDQSRSSPMVKVVGEKMAHLREEYEVKDKYPTVVLTDWHGNPLKTFLARSMRDRRLDPEALIREIKSVDRTVEAFVAKLDKDLDKGQKQFDKKRYPQALSALRPVARFKGYQASEKATDLINEIIDIGLEEVDRARRAWEQDASEAEKTLRRLSKDFEDTEVAKAADQALAELRGEE